MSGAILKICGLTRRADAEAAVRRGATHLGFVCWPGSPRFVPAEKIRVLHEGLAAIPVGVFVDATRVEVERICCVAGLRAAQLCGDEAAEEFRAFPHPLWRALRSPGALAGADAWTGAEAFLLDLAAGGKFGGTGAAGDDRIAAEFAARAPAILAGGLTPENVSARIRAVKPLGVDVASGVESAPGIKDGEKIAAFLAAARTAFAIGAH